MAEQPGDKHDVLLRLNDQRITTFNAVMRVREDAVAYIQQLERDLAAERRRAEAFKEAMHSYEQAARFERDKPVSSIEQKIEHPGRIPDLEAARRNADYWIVAAQGDVTDEKMHCLRQAIYAWKNAAYAMADQRDTARSAIAPNRLSEAVKWVLNDAAYKAPEQIGAVAERWIDRLRAATDETGAKRG